MRLIEKITNSARIQASLSLFVKIIVIISMLHSFYFHLWHILFADVLLLFLLFLPLILRKSNQINIPSEFEFILLIFIAVVFFFGDQRGLIIQAFFGIAIGFIGFAVMLILYSNSKIKPNYFLIIIFAFSISLALGVCAEILKYYLKIYLDYSIPDSDYTYLMRGLTLVAAGALISSIGGYFYMKGYRTDLMIRLVSRFKKKNPNYFIERIDSPEELLKIIKNGESEKLEFKSTLRINVHTAEHDKRVEDSSLKTIVAFMNSEGGLLLIGVSDKGEITGIEKDNFENNDKFNRHFTNLIKERIGNEFLPHIRSDIVRIEEKSVLKVECSASKKPVFLKHNENEEFYVRAAGSSLQLVGAKMIEYINSRFKVGN